MHATDTVPIFLKLEARTPVGITLTASAPIVIAQAGSRSIVCEARGAVGPASPSGLYVEAPAAALFPPSARREFPKSRPSGAAMLISPILFIFLGQPCSWLFAPARSWSLRRLARSCGTCSHRRKPSCLFA
jgi:hypothetical protein